MFPGRRFERRNGLHGRQQHDRAFVIPFQHASSGFTREQDRGDIILLQRVVKILAGHIIELNTRRIACETDHTVEAVSYRVRHFVEVAVFADRLVVRGIDQQGRVFDEVVVPERTSDLMRDSGVNAS